MSDDREDNQASQWLTGTTIQWTGAFLVDLRALDASGIGAEVIIARGRSSMGDGGGGIFTWTTDTSSPDDAGTIIFGVTIDLAEHPELAGKVVYMAVNFLATAPATLWLYMGGYVNSDSSGTVSGWRLGSSYFVMPSSGTVSVGFRKYGDSDVSLPSPCWPSSGRRFRRSIASTIA